MLTSLTLALLFNPFASAEGLAWTCHDAVYELCAVGDTLFARTSGGVLAIITDRVRTAVSMPPHVPVEKPNVKGDGAFLSAVTDYNEGKLASWWGGRFIYKLEGNTLIPFAPRPPASGDYSLLMHAGILYAGTNDGLHAYANNVWRRVKLGGELPFPRVHGIAKLGKDYVIGGIEGAAIGRPGNWKFISREPVRQVAAIGNQCWILFGSGSIDAIDINGKVWFDVLHGAAKRPWASTLEPTARGLLIGVSGGYIFKGSRLNESYPKELSGQTVTALAAVGDTIYIGTQRAGLFTIRGGRVSNITPSTGLSDPWVVAIASSGNEIYAATATTGIYSIRKERAVALDSPSRSVRNLAVRNGTLVVGALDGAWLQTANGWRELPSARRETTSLSLIEGKVWIGTPDGIAITK